MKLFDIWMEGFHINEGRTPGMYCGQYSGNTFQEACAKWNDLCGEPGYYDASRNTYYGCRFFDNEADARRSFG